MLIAAAAHAQQSVGTWSIIPHVGVNLSNITNNEVVIDATSNESAEAKYKAGMKVGFDVEYQATHRLALSAGIFYSMQGSRFADYACYNGINPEDSKENYTGFNDWKDDRQYVTVPLMLHYYIAPNLAINFGAQLGFLTKASNSFSQQDYTVDKQGQTEWTNERSEIYQDCKDVTAKFDFATPIGLSYEYENVIIDARYVHGWTKTNVGTLSEFATQRNKTFEFTVGYRFAL